MTNSGGINPGDTVGTSGIFTIDANYTQLTSGTLFIELGGLNPGEGYDQLVVTGTAQLGGKLDVSVINSFEPQVGETFERLTDNIFKGTFDKIVSTAGIRFNGASREYNV